MGKTGIEKGQVLQTDEMIDFMGKTKASRTEVTKAIWRHIKKHKLQRPKPNSRELDFDDVLGELLGVTHANMFELPGLLTPHFPKKKKE